MRLGLCTALSQRWRERFLLRGAGGLTVAAGGVRASTKRRFALVDEMVAVYKLDKSKLRHQYQPKAKVNNMDTRNASTWTTAAPAAAASAAAHTHRRAEPQVNLAAVTRSTDAEDGGVEEERVSLLAKKTQ